jgi:hypothetical protein
VSYGKDFSMIGFFFGFLYWKPTIRDILTNRKDIKFYDCLERAGGHPTTTSFFQTYFKNIV